MKSMKKAISLLLALVMCLGMLPMSAFAADVPEHEHNQNGWTCVYTEPVTKTDCTHQHDETCGYAAPTEGSSCTHEHNTDCGYAAAVEGVACTCGAVPDENGVVAHTDGCAYVEAKAEEPCKHQHDETCGYVEAKAEVPCTHVCSKESGCVTVATEGYWTCTAPVAEEVPAEVQAFLSAVAAIPADINKDNAEEAGELANAAFDAYEVLVDAGLDRYDGVADALARVEAAYAAIDAALDIESGTYGLVSGNYGGFVYSPRGEFETTDGTHICVQKWDFNNPKHPYEYYKYLKYWYKKGSSPQYEVYSKYFENLEADSSCFERCQNFVDRGSFMPQELQTRSVEAGTTAVFGYLVTTTDYSTGQGLGSQVPSVYLYDVVDVTQGEEYIAGGRESIRFYASEDRGLQGIWPYVNPNNPHIRMDTPIKSDAPEGATIQIRFRLAYGFEDAWWGNHDSYSTSSTDSHRVNNYFWYVEDFVYTLMVGGSGTTKPGDPTVDATHHVYMPAGTSTTIDLYKPFYSYKYYYGNGYYRDGNYSIKSKEVIQNGDENVATVGTLSIGTASGGGHVLRVPISSSADAEREATTEIKVKYVYGSDRVERTEKIIVHIIQPREQEIEAGEAASIPVLGNSAMGDFSRIKAPTSNTVVTVSNVTNSGYKATGKANASGSGTSEYQYLYCKETEVGMTGIEYVSYVEQTVYVDVTNFTVPQGGGDDPDTLDGLGITKEASETSVVDGDTLVYTLTVTNTSGVDKTVTVTDLLPNGVDFNRFDPANDQASYNTDNWTVTWTPTVPAGGNAVLKIVCDVHVTRAGSINNTAVLKSGDGNTKEATTSTPASPQNPGTDPALTGIEKALTKVEVLNTDGTSTDVTASKTVKAGDTVKLTYTITVKGEKGANYVVTDPDTVLVSGSLTGTLGDTLKAEITVTKTVTVKEAMTVKNTAFVKPGSDTDPIPDDPSKPTDSEKGHPSNEVTTEITVDNSDDGGIEVTKKLAEGQKPSASVGDEVKWDIVVKNNSAESKDVELTELLAGATLSESKFTLAAGEEKTVTATYKVTASDAGKELTNSVFVKAGDEKDVVTSDDTVKVIKITLVKTNRVEAIDSRTQVVHYTITMTNESEFSVYDLDLYSDVLTATVTDPATGNQVDTATITFGSTAMVGDKAFTTQGGGSNVTFNDGSENVHQWMRVDDEMQPNEAVTLTYDVTIRNTGRTALKVIMNNTAYCGAWIEDQDAADEGGLVAQAEYTVEAPRFLSLANMFAYDGGASGGSNVGGGGGTSGGGDTTPPEGSDNDQTTGSGSSDAEIDFGIPDDIDDPNPNPNPDPNPDPVDPYEPVIPDEPTPVAPNPPEVEIDDERTPLASANGLNSVDHFAYIIGYDDDTVRPENKITRAEVATIFFRLMTDVYRAANWSTTNDFSDVAAGSWYNNAISTCAKAGLVNGYSDGTFKPDQSITRAEFATIAARFLDEEITGAGAEGFADIEGHWAETNILRAAEAGWVNGDNGRFRPDDYISRAEVMTIVNRMLNRVPDEDHLLPEMKTWSDNPKTAWYYEAVQEATNEHAYEWIDENVENWTELLTIRDWAALEKEWATAYSAGN